MPKGNALRIEFKRQVLYIPVLFRVGFKNSQ
jgi:hypothetical protein